LGFFELKMFYGFVVGITEIKEKSQPKSISTK
jgi:hypothetical protein